MYFGTSLRVGSDGSAQPIVDFGLAPPKRSGSKSCRGHVRLEGKADLAEPFGTFVQNELTTVAHQSPINEETRQLGLKRYQVFIDLGRGSWRRTRNCGW
jgi:hypothetical protein